MLRELFEGTNKKMRFLPEQKPLKCGGEGGIRTHVPVKANAFRVRPVMSTSIRLRIYKTQNSLFFITLSDGAAPLCPVAVPKKFIAKYCLNFLTAATPYCSLHLPQAALANVPTSIRLHIKFA